MINIRMTHYSTAEKELLKEILAKAVFDSIRCYGYCDFCEVHNLCRDLQSALVDVMQGISEDWAR